MEWRISVAVLEMAALAKTMLKRKRKRKRRLIEQEVVG